MNIIPFVLPIIVMIVMQTFFKDNGYGGAPAAAGIPFKKDQR
jgi:ABC-type uncharacterized transport system permease subunit